MLIYSFTHGKHQSITLDHLKHPFLDLLSSSYLHNTFRMVHSLAWSTSLMTFCVIVLCVPTFAPLTVRCL